MLKTNKAFLSKFLTIALPIAAQAFVMSSLNMIDTIMVGQLGDFAVASVGIANQLYFMVLLYLLGIKGGCSIFAAQFFGKKEICNMKKVVGLGMVLGLSISSVYTLFMILFPREVFLMFTADQQVIELGTGYLRIAAISYIMTTVTTVYGAVTRSAGNTKLPMQASILGIGLNTVLNYILIFGKFGMPAMGVEGAAIATVIARTVEMVYLLSVIYIRKHEGAAGIKDFLSFSGELFNRFISQSGLMIIKDVVWGLGMTAYIAIFARMSTEAAAAANIANTVGSLAFILVNGVAGASMIMVGQKLGEDAYEDAYDYAMFFRNLVIGLSLLIGLAMYLGRYLFIMPFNVSDLVAEYVVQMIVLRALFFVFLGYNNITIVGIMRSGGDTMFSLILDLVAVWFIGLPLAFVIGMVLKLPLMWVVLGILSQEVFKSVLCHRRVLSKRWMNNLVNDIA